jgi:hypothetical protein
MMQEPTRPLNLKQSSTLEVFKPNLQVNFDFYDTTMITPPPPPPPPTTTTTTLIIIIIIIIIIVLYILFYHSNIIYAFLSCYYSSIAF